MPSSSEVRWPEEVTFMKKKKKHREGASNCDGPGSQRNDSSGIQSNQDGWSQRESNSNWHLHNRRNLPLQHSNKNLWINRVDALEWVHWRLHTGIGHVEQIHLWLILTLLMDITKGLLGTCPTMTSNTSGEGMLWWRCELARFYPYKSPENNLETLVKCSLKKKGNPIKVSSRYLKIWNAYPLRTHPTNSQGIVLSNEPHHSRKGRPLFHQLTAT